MARELKERPAKQAHLQPESPAKRIERWQWKPGQSGNPKGRAPGSGKLLKILQDKLAANGNELAEAIADRFIEILIEGEHPVAMKALMELFDRIEGRAIKRVEVDVKSQTKLVVLEDEGEEDEPEEAHL